MSLNGIDISSHQTGIDLKAVPCDFVIAKATQGTGYVNPDCSRAIEQARGMGKAFGVYHYIDGSGAIAEADHFVASIADWIGHGVLALDWESGENSAWGDTGYLAQVADRVIARTGIRPLVYCMQSVLAQVQAVASPRDCGLWVAQYPDSTPTGYQAHPWNEGAYDCAIRQYTSAGRLPGYAGDLDLDVFYGDESAWNRYANPDGRPTAPAPAPASAPQPAGGTVTVQAGDTLSGIAARLGTTWQHLQRLNDLADPDLIHPGQTLRTDGTPATGTTYTVQPGDTLSGIAARLGTTWQHLQQTNHIGNPDLIHPGDTINL